MTSSLPRYLTLLIISLLRVQMSFAQTGDAWIRFDDARTNLIGYKDLTGNIRIPPSFEPITQADSFYHIMAVDPAGVDSPCYYLLKKGRHVGRDSVFTYDYTFDCESEEKILFKDRKRDRVGYFNKDGEVIVPAVYNYATPFHGGCAIALRNARRKCWSGEDSLNCEHPGWEGGDWILISDRNEILAESLKIAWYNLDWYSKRVNEPRLDTGIYIHIRGTNEQTYSFIDFEKEFRRWFYDVFLPATASKNGDDLENLCFPRVTYWSNGRGWISRNRAAFLNKFSASLSRERFIERKISIRQDDLNRYIFHQSRYRKYYTACGEPNKYRYPLLNVMLTYYKRKNPEATDRLGADSSADYEIDYQDHFDFLKTEEGYRLLSVSLRR